MSMTIALCDDDAEQMNYLKKLLDEWAAKKALDVTIHGYGSGEAFLFSYPDMSCDLLLLDIEMGGMSGMELAKMLRARGDGLPILFITAYSEYISEGYDVEALHYLMKPIEKEKLFAVLDRQVERYRDTAGEFLITGVDGTTHVEMGRVVYMEAFGRRTAVHLSDGTVLDCEKGIGQFDMPDGFIRSHRSYLVNLRYVRSIGKTALRLDTGEEIPLSRRLFSEVNRQFARYYTKLSDGNRL